MRTLQDASRALLDDLSTRVRMRLHWRDAGWAIAAAIDTPDPVLIRIATDRLFRAVEAEGWMERGAGVLPPMEPLPRPDNARGERVRQFEKQFEKKLATRRA
jgi:hypothetical protein